MSAKSDGLPFPIDPATIDPDPEAGAIYYADAYQSRPRIKPNDRVGACWFRADPARSAPLLGMAEPRGHIGGTTWETPFAALADAPPPEVVWQLVLEYARVASQTVRLAKKQTLDGRFVLRLGQFVELAEDAV